ncbi:Protein of unknown function (DUF2889) [Desulfosporosinus orientis DSM 765]|uniref:DUF2889 domain-containing protein n=1 Tax=Desulfosporosinus orientis (strain ATCC 19365 / DSM 765 / NCIMB 8382 / VKM B-1628 / Singapore I) TaxID=768706 RepID=G7WI62_DESOD|nr:DUF2889 domain-containing protein [Desulfosporosinus orientis]AET70985.1 Protein of unknown function (DUF2889) [Desulfosporosinus orientis DSM 765]
MYLFNRSISVNVHSQDLKILRVEGIFIDTHHELCLTLEVDIETYRIVSAQGELRRSPHSDCQETQERIQNLVGINLKKNVRKQILAAVGLKNGCTHITDLTLECVKGVMQATYQLMHKTMEAEQVDELVNQFLAGSCLHYQQH